MKKKIDFWNQRYITEHHKTLFWKKNYQSELQYTTENALQEELKKLIKNSWNI